MTVLTYHQVLPSFLDFIYSFGIKQYAEDTGFNDFRTDIRISNNSRATPLHAIGRSGRDIRLCFSLQSIERTKLKQPLAWSVRRSSVFHSFDLELGTTAWIIVKGNAVLKQRMEALSRSRAYTALVATDSTNCLAPLFKATLLAHVEVVDWACDQWRWYLNELNEEFQSFTRPIYAVPTRPRWKEMNPIRPFMRMNTDPPPQQPPSPPPPPVGPGHSLAAHPSMNGTSHPMQSLQRVKTQTEPDVPVIFDFDDIKGVQFIEDKVIEALMVMENNATIISRMRSHYEALTSLTDWPEELREECKADFEKFVSSLNDAEDHMHRQEAKARIMLKTLNNRREIVCAMPQRAIQCSTNFDEQLYRVLEYKNIEASKSQTREMQKVTQEMQHVAVRTLSQTALMTLIALITIIYLPATFISVSLFLSTSRSSGPESKRMQTLMSSEVLKLDTTHRPMKMVSQWPALKMFLYISLPMTVLTLTFCVLGYHFLNKTKRKTVVEGSNV